ncbi:Xaa-Pro dipeptidase [Candidatus Peregrinibacteria bacterium CG11_big_fil_rev_8_21_14_0_20_41_10]|nr:MAG: Xaa-Pro dipeptidase [Candidatus Peregrinibacteria bacterium CG11_big_fil_rev_8_21_14_0_20_41_10]PIZ75498.1 MAG: Xaa-Pro dipeptidase [Candidatus Peregrinibacteria bacterium CG_4_10_14_0_2_um_filter_41_8]
MIKNLSALYLTKPENIRYFTGFIGTFGIALVSSNHTYLITDGRYTEQAKKLCNKKTQIIIIKDSLNEEIKKLAQKHKWQKVGFEGNHLTYYQALKIRRDYKPLNLTPLGGEIDQLRIIKTEQEISTMKESQHINEKTLTETLKFLKVGITEAEIAWKIREIAYQLGATELAFDPIIAFGKNSSSPHYTPDHKCKLKKGDVVLIDMGVKYEGYCSDMTRTFFTKPPSTQEAEVYNTVLAAQVNAINKLKPGMRGKQGDLLSRQIIEQAGYGDHFAHANGHGVGLEIHESPSLSSKSKHQDRNMRLAKNMIITVEPGIYLPGKFGVRIEDMIVIKDEQNINLTKFPKQIIESFQFNL